MTEAKDAATVLERAADSLLVNGRCRDNLQGPSGEGCVIWALAVGGGPARGYCAAEDALSDYVLEHFGHLIVTWNQRTDSDDEVRDTLLLVAKDLRNEATA